MKGAISGIDTGQNRLYSIDTHQEYEASPNIFVTGTLQLFSHYVYCLLNLGYTLSYITHYVAIHLCFYPKYIYCNTPRLSLEVTMLRIISDPKITHDTGLTHKKL